MPTASISGLASGLDTATIINQLMQLEAQPQTNLKTKLADTQGTVQTLQDLNARVASLTTRAEKLAGGTGFGLLAAKSSHEGVTVTGGSGTTLGTFAFTVDRVATAHRLSFLDVAAGDDVVVTGGTMVDLTVGGTTTAIDTANGTLDGLVNALNASGTGVNASKIKLDDGSYRLLVTATETGAESSFTLTNTDGSALLGGATVTAGTDAQITLGSDTIHSATNTFSDVIPGVDVKISSAAIGDSVDVTIAKDTDQVRGNVKSLVDAINGLLGTIDGLTDYDPETKTSGTLSGEASVRQLRNDLLNAIYPDDGTSLADVGIQVDRFGRLVFDEDKFAEAYAADPAGVAARFTASDVEGEVGGFAARIAAVADVASNATTGTLTSAINGRNTQADRLQDSIDDWDRRLELRRTSLERQFTALETAMSQMQAQSSWLSGQIASLPSWE